MSGKFRSVQQVSLDIVAVIARLQVADKLPFTARSLIVQGVCALEPADSSRYLCDLNGGLQRKRARKLLNLDVVIFFAEIQRP